MRLRKLPREHGTQPIGDRHGKPAPDFRRRAKHRAARRWRPRYPAPGPKRPRQRNIVTTPLLLESVRRSAGGTSSKVEPRRAAPNAFFDQPRVEQHVRGAAVVLA